MSWWEPSRTWSSGQWSLQVGQGALEQVRFGKHLVLRGIRAVVRDHDWATAPLRVAQVQETADSLDLAVHTSGLSACLSGHLRVRACGADLSVDLDLHSDGNLATNRTGLVVLHPPDLAGTEVQVTHPDADHPGGETEQTVFPVSISPHQPMRDIRGLQWACGGERVQIWFDGDVFEMEDQRNWSDASYKTYSRPLDLPFPYTLRAGERVQQRVRVQVGEAGDGGVRVAGPAALDAAAHSKAPDLIELHPGAPFPDLQLGASTAPDPAPALPRKRAGGPDAPGAARVVELDLGSPAWPAALNRAARAGLPLDVRLVLTEEAVAGGDGGEFVAGGDVGEATAGEAGEPATAGGAGELNRAVRMLRDLDVLRICAYQGTGPAEHITDAAAVEALRSALGSAGLETTVVGGARSQFTEYNRQHQLVPQGVAGVVFGITPLFHDLSTRQLVESVAMQRLIARQATAMTSLPVHIGPMTLRPRFNNVATTPAPRADRPDLSSGYGPALIEATDTRQEAPELAAWTIASAAALAVPGVASLTYFEDWGPRGIYDSAGAPYPVAAAIEALDALRGGQALIGDSPDGLIWAVGVTGPEGVTILVANIDDHERHVTVTTPAGSHSLTLSAGSWRSRP